MLIQIINMRIIFYYYILLSLHVRHKAYQQRILKNKKKIHSKEYSQMIDDIVLLCVCLYVSLSRSPSLSILIYQCVICYLSLHIKPSRARLLNLQLSMLSKYILILNISIMINMIFRIISRITRIH